MDKNKLGVAVNHAPAAGDLVNFVGGDVELPNSPRGARARKGKRPLAPQISRSNGALPRDKKTLCRGAQYDRRQARPCFIE